MGQMDRFQTGSFESFYWMFFLDSYTDFTNRSRNITNKQEGFIVDKISRGISAQTASTERV